MQTRSDTNIAKFNQEFFTLVLRCYLHDTAGGIMMDWPVFFGAAEDDDIRVRSEYIMQIYICL